jgi:hypothetical protein
MRPPILILLAVAITAMSPSVGFGSGSAGARPPASATRQTLVRANSADAQVRATESSQTTVAEEPYDLGKALFNGKYRFGNPSLTPANVAEKMQRLVTLQRTLPRAERAKLDPEKLSRRLTNREMNGLEYYLGMRFGKFIAKEPSWAKAEPPPKVALSN